MTKLEQMLADRGGLEVFLSRHTAEQLSEMVTGQVVAGSQGWPSASMARTSMRRWPCLAAVDR